MLPDASFPWGVQTLAASYSSYQCLILVSCVNQKFTCSDRRTDFGSRMLPKPCLHLFCGKKDLVSVVGSSLVLAVSLNKTLTLKQPKLFLNHENFTFSKCSLTFAVKSPTIFAQWIGFIMGPYFLAAKQTRSARKDEEWAVVCFLVPTVHGCQSHLLTLLEWSQLWYHCAALFKDANLLNSMEILYTKMLIQRIYVFIPWFFTP